MELRNARYLLGVLLSVILLGTSFVTSGLEKGILVSLRTNTKFMEFLPEFDGSGDSWWGCFDAVRRPELAELVGELGKHFEDLVN
jgi:hypothetical protein